MKGYEASRIAEASEHRRDVAVGDKDFGMSSDFGRIKLPQQIVRTISATGADDRADVVAHKHLLQLTRATFRGTGKVQILFENRIQVERVVSKIAERRATLLEKIALDVTGRSDDSDLVAGAQVLRPGARDLGRRI